MVEQLVKFFVVFFVVVEPVFPVGLLFALLLAARADGRRLTHREWTAAVAAVGGLAAFLIAAQPSGGQRFGSSSWLACQTTNRPRSPGAIPPACTISTRRRWLSRPECGAIQYRKFFFSEYLRYVRFCLCCCLLIPCCTFTLNAVVNRLWLKKVTFIRITTPLGACTTATIGARQTSAGRAKRARHALPSPGRRSRPARRRRREHRARHCRLPESLRPRRLRRSL